MRSSGTRQGANQRIGRRRKSRELKTRRERSRKERRRVYMTKRHGALNRDAPRRLPGRHTGIHGVRGPPCDAPAWAPGDTSPLQARTPRAPRAFGGGSPHERRGSGTTPLPRNRPRSPALETECIGGGGPSGPGSSHPCQANGRGDHRAPRTCAAEGFGADGTIAAWTLGQRSMPLPWIICSNVSTTRKKCSGSWRGHERV